MSGSIFSTYSSGENRVTASILAVLRSLSLRRTERLLGALLEQSEFELVHFENQVAQGGKGVPDAVILSSCRLFIETKLDRKSVNAAQIRRHLVRLKGATETTRLLLVLTPDESPPKVLDTIKDKRVAWASFSALDQAIEELLNDAREVISEREAFLLRELQAMLVEEELVGSSNEVLVVPARHAWFEYEKVHAYVCQPNRTFQRVRRMAFYSNGTIHPLVPTIRATHESVVFEPGEHGGELGALIDKLIDLEYRDEGASYKVMFLSAPDDPATLHLKAPIKNDLRSESGAVVAFTQNQRYVSLDRLLKAKTTSDLVED